MRKITSLTLVVSGLIELVTCVVLYIIPSGRVAYWVNYRLFGLSKTQWGDIHITIGTLLILALVLHVYYNWFPITAYLKNKAKQLTVFTKSFNVAFAISIYVVAGTIYSLPPMNYVIQLGEHFTNIGNKKYGEPPYGHAELSSLKMFCDKMHIDLTEAVNKLKGANIKIDNIQRSLKEIAKNNNITPQQLYKIIKINRKKLANGKTKFPDSPFPGFGNKTIQDICQLYSLSIPKVQAQLNEAGLQVRDSETVKEIGENNDSNPMAIFEIIKQSTQ